MPMLQPNEIDETDCPTILSKPLTVGLRRKGQDCLQLQSLGSVTSTPTFTLSVNQHYAIETQRQTTCVLELL